MGRAHFDHLASGTGADLLCCWTQVSLGKRGKRNPEETHSAPWMEEKSINKEV